MLARLNDAFDVQKQFSANAAHELRTPLAVMQTNLEVFSKKKEPFVSEYQTLFSTILEQTNRLSHLASILLDMTGMQRVKPVSYTHLDVYKRQHQRFISGKDAIICSAHFVQMVITANVSA